jgi:hypothetical protein
MSSNSKKPGKKLSVNEMRKLKGGTTPVDELKCLPLGSTCGGECVDPYPECCPGTYCTGLPGRGNPIGSCVYRGVIVDGGSEAAPQG